MFDMMGARGSIRRVHRLEIFFFVFFILDVLFIFDMILGFGT